jgi:hypothetical protein
MGRCGQWGIGDWILYGNAKFGERYTRAATITGYDAQTLMNMVYVASKFEISRRREALSWSHHESVAALDREEQERWLDLAAAERLSVADLRVEVRSSRRAAKAVDAGAGDDLPQLGSGGRGSHADSHSQQRAHESQKAGCDERPRTRRSIGTELLICPNCGHTVPLPERYRRTAG